MFVPTPMILSIFTRQFVKDVFFYAFGDGEHHQLCEALLTLHAIADEACAGLFVALDRSDGLGCRYRARGRELLARTGSLARMHTQLLRVLPKT